MPDTTSPVPKLEKALAFAAEQVRGTVERYPDFYPMYTRAGRWKHGGTGSASRASRPSGTS